MGEVVGHHGSEELTVESEDRRLHGLAQSDRVLGQGLEDRLEIEGGPADHLEQLAGRRLLLEGDPQLAVARLQFLEQADVFDGDDGLIGEGLEQLDLLVAEGADLRPADQNGCPSPPLRAPEASRASCDVLRVWPAPGLPGTRLHPPQRDPEHGSAAGR